VRTTFSGLNIGAKGLAAQQRALEITGHNIANANTVGYTRQEVVMQADMPVKTINGFIGTGVKITDVRRIRDNYLDLQFRTETKFKGYWDFRDNTLQKIEVILNEPSDVGLRSTMDKFWSSWEDLSRKPESSAIRTTVIETGQAVVETFNHMDRQFRELRDDIDNSINVNIRELNSIALQIRDLNYQIVKGEAEGPKANDLRDKRDLLLDQMAEIVDIEVVEDKWGSIFITIGGRPIVAGNVVNEITGKEDATNSGLTEILWKDGSKVNIRSGGLKGMLEARDEIVVDFMEKLDKMALNFAQKINKVHGQGFHIVDTVPILSNYQGYSHGEKIDFTSPITINGSNNILSFKIDGNALPVSITLTSGNYSDLDSLVKEINKQLENNSLNAKAFNVNGSIRLISNTVANETKGENSEITIDYTALNNAANTLGFYETSVSGHEKEFQGKAASFFMTTDKSANFSAANIAINTDIVDLVNLIAAATNTPYNGIEDIEGDGSNALNIAQLKYDNSMIDGATFDDYYRSETAKLGIKAREAQRMVENQGLLITQLENKREMVMGVSLDEEMTNMIRFQHAYNSAARYITAVDQMLETLINRIGLVGR
jgi:flagellar hook-associated protein 1 FlgK